MRTVVTVMTIYGKCRVTVVTVPTVHVVTAHVVTAPTVKVFQCEIWYG